MPIVWLDGWQIEAQSSCQRARQACLCDISYSQHLCSSPCPPVPVHQLQHTGMCLAAIQREAMKRP